MLIQGVKIEPPNVSSDENGGKMNEIIPAPHISGNGNGNKMNLRIEILENLLNASGGTGDGSSAKINSLRKAINLNKSDMADDASKSLDVLRQVFQHDFTKEIKDVIDRQLQDTFMPAFENLKRNGFEVTQSDINEVACAILDGAKRAFMPPCDSPPNVCIPASFVVKKKKLSSSQTGNGTGRIYDSDDNESDGSIISFGSSQFNGSSTGGGTVGTNGFLPKKRGRPRKIDIDTGRNGTPIMSGIRPVTFAEANKWDPLRINSDCRFVTASKLNKLLGFGNRVHVFTKYSKMFRYVADEDDKIWLFNRNYSTRMNKKLFLILLSDAMEICCLENGLPQALTDLHKYSFNLPDVTLQKIQNFMGGIFEQLKVRVVDAPQSQHNQSQQTINVAGQYQMPTL